MQKPDIIVIGGGASGMLAALVARRNGNRVTLLERNAKIGRKVLVTGNGRCNYTNTLAAPDHYNHPAFVAPALAAFGPEATIRFFASLGIAPKIEDRGKTFPLSEQAASVVDVLQYELETLGVELVPGALVQSVAKQSRGFRIFLEDGRRMDAEKVILCTGGCALPESGSDGSGHRIAASLGHAVTPVFPALVKLTLQSPFLKQLDGVKIDARAQLLVRRDVIGEDAGDILFTKYGISGPPILSLSRMANERMARNDKVTIRIVLVNGLDRAGVEKRFDACGDKSVAFSLVGLIHKKLIPAVLRAAGISEPEKPVSALGRDDRRRLVSTLFDWTFEVTGSKGFDDAQITAGGVSIDEIDPATMQSKLHPGLYFAGEIVDVDGLCGGYNLQWAWSSAHLAAMHASGGVSQTDLPPLA